MPGKDGTGPMGTGQGRGRCNMPGSVAGRGNRQMGRGFGGGPAGLCTCPACGFSESHKAGEPCMKETCPKCGHRMYRKQ